MTTMLNSALHLANTGLPAADEFPHDRFSPRYVTQLVESSGRPVGKVIQLDENGNPVTKAQANTAVWIARTVEVRSLIQLQKIIDSQESKHALILEYIPSTVGIDRFWLISQKKVDEGFKAKDGAPVHQLKKDNFAPGGINVFDWDHDESRPVHLRDKKPSEWWNRLASIIPPLANVGRLIVPSSKSQVYRSNGTPVFESPSYHVYVLSENRQLMESVGKIIDAQMWLNDQGYIKSGKAGQELKRSPFDPCTFGISRRVFESAPVVSEGLELRPKKTELIEGDLFDMGAIPSLSDTDQVKYKKLTGRKLTISHEGDVVTTHVSADDLELSLMIETQDLGVLTVQQIIDQFQTVKKHIRCQTPFRESDSWAAFISWHDSGEPFLFDVGSQTKHTLSAAASAELAFADVEVQSDHVPTHEDFTSLIAETDPNDLKAFMDLNQQIGNSELSAIEITDLHKQIKAKAGIALGALRADIEENRVAAKQLDEQELTGLVLNEVNRDNLIYFAEWFYLWDNTGVWKCIDDRLIKKKIHLICGKQEFRYTSHLVDAVANLIKTESFRRDHEFDQDGGTINVLNGELHFDSEKGVWKLFPHNRDHFRTTQLPVIYDPAAEAPRFWQFLTEVFTGDPEVQSKAIMVLELIGYSLLTTCRYEKFALLIGTGANGKSVLLGVLKALIGKPNTCAVQPSRFDNPFNRAHLQGRLANIVTEIAEGADIADAQLKAIVSGELTTAEHKLKHPFDFHPFATCWFGTNHMPHTRDFSDALFRRAIVLTFPNKFEGERCDPHLKEKLVTELPGILIMALGAISGVLTRGEFTTCRGNEDAKKDWRQEADQVAQFVDECCKSEPQATETTKELYEVYKRWAEQAGIRRTLNKKNFGVRLERLAFPADRTNQNRQRTGIKIVDYCGLFRFPHGNAGISDVK